jgi:ubiquinone/menaquinone biosynthesis C-methylase UbiE
MHAFARHLHSQSGKASGTSTRGRVVKGGWRYDFVAWFCDTFLFHGKIREFRQRTITLACLQPGEHVLDVGCGTGTLTLEVARHIGHGGRIVGVDPGMEQIARARAKAARRQLAIEFQTGVIEQLPYPEATFDVVFSTLMMHHLPAPLKRQGLSEIARVLRPGGRLVIADFSHKKERTGQAMHFHAGESRTRDLAVLVKDAGFEDVETEEMPPARSSMFPGVGFVYAHKPN